ncbi:MFS transporter [Corticicoccus populi]|uniref:MFS transporter n=1 Tax=Corticicoccus populi TaxID=1812821 RepID=A0ABW5WS89_9STAP
MILDKTIPFQERINFIIYVFSRVLLSIGDHVYLFAVSYFILFETGSAFYFSINMAIAISVSLLLLPFSGMLSDLGNKRNIVIRGELLYTCVILGLFVYSYFYGISLTAIYITTFLTSLIEPFVSNAFQTAMTELFHKSRIQKVSGYVSAIMSTAVIGGPILGGVLYGLLSFNQIILLFFVLFMLSAILDFFLKFGLYHNPDDYSDVHNSLETAGTFSKFKSDISQGMKFIIRTPVIKRMFILSAFINLFGASMSIFPEKMMISELGFSSQMVGYANAVLGIGMLTGGLILGRLKRIESPLTFQKYSLIGLSLVTILYPLPIYISSDLVTHFIYISIMGFSLAVGMQFANIPSSIFIQLVVPQKIKGRVFSSLSLISMSLMPLGSIIYGILYDMGGYWVINLTAGIILISIVLINYTKPVLTESRDMYQKVLKEADEELEENSYGSAETSS